MAVIAASMLAACGFSAELPSGGGPSDGGVDGKVIDGPPTDVDGDGVLNEADNCPEAANAGQENEDGDERGDVCDPCPHLTGGSDGDIDDDGIGNGCDPRPTSAGDVLVYFNGFYVDGALPAGMSVVHGQAAWWSVSGGALVFTRGSDDWGMPVVDAGGTRHTVDTTVEITAAQSGTASAAGVAVDVEMDDSDLIECQSRVDIGRREMWRRNPGAPDGWSGPLASSNASTPIDTYRIVLQRAGSDSFCTNTRGGNLPVVLSDDTNALDNTRAGLFARNVTARFRYIAVYRSP